MSAFWAVLGIALTTMAFPSGTVLDISSKWTFFYRSSPLFCACATVHSIYLLCMHSCERRSLRKGWASRARIRFQDESNASSELEKLRRNSWFIFGIFLVGGPTQPIKIFATSIITSIQILCGL